MTASRSQRGSLAELARVFLKLGTISFGGPAAHIALMRHELVERRQWLADQEFLDLVGAANLIPGPNSTEVALHIGRVRGGWRGLLVAGACFILPAVIMVAAIAEIYTRVGQLPSVQAIFYGLKPVVVAIVAVALFRLARTAIRSVTHGVMAAAAIAAVGFGLHELIVLGVAGIVGGAARAGARLRHTMISLAALSAPVAVPASASAVAFGSGTLFLVFLKAGALLFGSGYVLLAFIRADLVERLHWLTEQQLLDAIAVGQFTPGPVFTTATFVGHILAGSTGATVATIAMFLPAFIYVAISGPVVPWLRASPIAAGVLDGVNVASLALMAAVSWQLARVAIIDVPTVVLAAAALIGLVMLRVNPAWLMVAGAAIGRAVYLIAP